MSEQELLQFNEMLLRYQRFYTIFLVIFFIIGLVLFFFCLKTGIIKSKGVRIALCLFALLILMIYVMCVLPYQLDISKGSYEEYSGEFYIEDYYFASRSGTYITIRRPNEGEAIRYKAPSDLKGIKKDTTYTGTFIFAKHSKALVKITLDDL